MTEIVVHYDKDSGNFQVYESGTKTLIIGDTLGQCFRDLNLFLLENKIIDCDIVDSTDIMYHIDSQTFHEFLKTNIALVKRIQDIPSEFKNSANKFGKNMSSPSSSSSFGNKKEKSTNFKRGTFSGTSFGKSSKKFGYGR